MRTSRAEPHAKPDEPPWGGSDSTRESTECVLCACLTYPVDGYSTVMIIIGLILLLLGFFLAVPLLWTLGIIVLIIGLVLLVAGQAGRQVGGRAHYW